MTNLKKKPTNGSVTYTTASDQDLQQILTLQKLNLKSNLTPTEQESEGFVTVDHNINLLRKMNSPYPHVVAKDDKKVIGYCLVMLPTLRSEIPILTPMFDTINQLKYNDVSIDDTRYFIMGQVCIDKRYRGKGVFHDMYKYMHRSMSSDFDYIITEVSAHNQRSLKAHYNQGFNELHNYKDPDGHPWVMIIMEMV